MNESAQTFAQGVLGRPLEFLGVCTDECIVLEERGVTVPAELFPLIAPSALFRGTIPPVYRSHVRELLERFEAGGDLSLGTAAESLLKLVALSLAAPPARGYRALYWKLAADVLGDDAQRLSDGADREEWPGQVADLERSVRRSIRTGRPKRIAVSS